MIRDCRRPTIQMPKLPVRPPLSHFDETQTEENRHDDARSQRWDAPHRSGDFKGLRADERGFERRFAVLAQHLDDLKQVLAQLVKRRALRMRARPARHVADEEAGVLISFNHRSVGSHRNPEEGGPRKFAAWCRVRQPLPGSSKSAMMPRSWRSVQA